MDTAACPLASDPQDCPVDATLRVIGGRWKPLILYNLRGGALRFNELRRRMPTVTQRMLTQHLRELEADGIVERTVFIVVPPHVTYAISAEGRGLLPVLDAMAAWGLARGLAAPAPGAAPAAGPDAPSRLPPAIPRSAA